MSFIQNPKEENSPYLQFLLLIFYAIIGLITCFILAFIVLFLIYGKELIRNPAILVSPNLEYRPALQILLFAQSVGLFLLPPIFLAITEGKRVNAFYEFNRPRLKLLALVFLLIIVSSPLLEWISVFNQKMTLPDFLKGVEEWMRRSENSLKETTLVLLKMSSIPEFLLNIFLIAFVAAVSEELMFRGAIQRIFNRVFNSPHAAIWVSAFIFSAIHMQFYGFLPRFLLGAGFGYLYLWSGSLWYSILAHFLNNAFAVCQAYYMQKHNMSMDIENVSYFAWYGYIISFALSIIVFTIFKKQSE
jgi:membrane protease YdiL (CAAX protease family)